MIGNAHNMLHSGCIKKECKKQMLLEFIGKVAPTADGEVAENITIWMKIRKKSVNLTKFLWTLSKHHKY